MRSILPVSLQFRRNGSLYKEKKRISDLKKYIQDLPPNITRSDDAGTIFSPKIKLLGPRHEKEAVSIREQWRKQFQEALLKSQCELRKFPFAIYNDKQNEASYENAVRALVYRSNSGITKKRYPCMPSIAVAVTPCSREELKRVESMVVNERNFGINPLTCVWLLSSTIANLQTSPETSGIPAMFPKIVLFSLIDQLRKDNDQKWREFYENRVSDCEKHNGDEAAATSATSAAAASSDHDYLKSHYAVDFVKSSLDKDKHRELIVSLSRAEYAVFLDNTKKNGTRTCDENEQQNSLFMSKCQMMRALKFCGKPDAFLHGSDKIGLTRIFVVSDSSVKYRNQYVEAFKTGACLIMARGLIKHDQLKDSIKESINNVSLDLPLPTLCLFFRSVSLTLRSIEMFFRYFLHHMAFLKQSRVESDFVPHTYKPIAERVQRLKKRFEQIIRETKLFYKKDDESKLDWAQLRIMFQCMSLLQDQCMHHDADDDIKAMWEIFSQTEQKKKPLSLENPKRYFERFDEKMFKNFQQNECRVEEQVESAVKFFKKMLHSFDFGWHEPFHPADAEETFYASVDQIAEIAESQDNHVFIIPGEELKLECLATAISRAAISSHFPVNQSASVRLFGETALMSAACLGNKDCVEALMEGCSLSQIVCRSQHPKALGLDALFMSLFYGHCDIAKVIVKRILDCVKGESNTVLEKLPEPFFCVHAESGCTSFMLACRYGDKELLDDLFKFLDKCGSPPALRSSSAYNNDKRAEELLRKDLWKANALHHAIITANAGAVEWLKKERDEYYVREWDKNQQPKKNEDQEEVAAAHQVNDEPSVFQSGFVAEVLATSMLSPTFAQLCISYQVFYHQAPGEEYLKRLIKEAIRSDFDLLNESLLVVNKVLVSQSDPEPGVDKDVDSLQEYELAVMMWGLCVRDQAAKKLEMTKFDALQKDRSIVADDELDDLTESETSTRGKIAMQLTELSEEDKWDSQWFKVYA